MLGERRRSERIRVRDGSFACISLEGRKVGAILDISAEGVAFKYMMDEKRNVPLTGSAELEIFNRDGDFHLKGIRFKAASDVPLKGPYFMPSAFMRRLGGRFEGITPDQRDQLGRFIREFTV